MSATGSTAPSVGGERTADTSERATVEDNDHETCQTECVFARNCWSCVCPDSGECAHTVYLYVKQPANIRLVLKLKLKRPPDRKDPASVCSAQVNVQVAGQTRAFAPSLGAQQHSVVDIGRVDLPHAGYHPLTVTVLSAGKPEFGELQVCSQVPVHFIRDSFHFGRRGPSVHLKYKPPVGTVQAFYNELTVPAGNDVVGSFFMAAGFAHGYFGVQVNSATERRVLFSVWHSQESMQDGHACDQLDTCRVTNSSCHQQGTVKAFDHEGSGGQSWRVLDWKAGVTYKFLLVGKQLETSCVPTAEYRAYICVPDEQDKEQWMHHATFLRPHTKDSLTGIHSFLENFREETGNQRRRVHFANQWMRDDKGTWSECDTASLTVDNTAKRENRFDYEGGVDGDAFYLTNCGFFNKCAGCVAGNKYTRATTGRPPSEEAKRLVDAD